MQDEKLSSADGFGNAPKSKGLSQRCLVQTLTHKRTYVPNWRKLCIYLQLYICLLIYIYAVDASVVLFTHDWFCSPLLWW